jgi:putative heme-binding domain-containing protein
MRTACVLLLASLLLPAQSRDSNPFARTDASALAQGRRLYSYYCVFCHGMDGVSGRGAQLASAYRKHGAGDREMYRTIADGVPGTEMSGHWLEEDEIWKILLFVRQLEQGAGAQGCGPGPGDPQRGRALFDGRAGCRGCHHAASRLGPDLAGLGASRSREHLRLSITDPGRDLSPRYRTVRVRTPSGEAVRGLLLSQDEYTIHLLDLSERVRSFRRDSLAESVLEPGSLMPLVRLTATETDDVVAWLCSGGKR